MSFFARLLSSISIPIIIMMLFFLIQELNSKELQKNLTEEHIVIRLSKVYLWIGILDIAVFSTFCFIMFFFPNDTTTWWVWMIFIFFILLGFCLVCSTLIFKIDIYRNKDYFLYRNIFLKTRKIYYCECINYQCTQSCVLPGFLPPYTYIEFGLFPAGLSDTPYRLSSSGISDRRQYGICTSIWYVPNYSFGFPYINSPFFYNRPEHLYCN